MKDELRVFLTALMFFTRIPCPKWVGYSESLLNQASRYFPLVGVLVGFIAALVFQISHYFFPLPVAILLSMLSSIWLTGAFHEDGLSDACDGFGGGWTPENILRIMKDSRVGSYGVVGLWVALSLKLFSLYSIPEPMIFVSLIAGHSVSRFFAGSFIYSDLYVQEDLQSKVKPLARRMPGRDLVISAIWGLSPLLLFFRLDVFLVIIPLALAKWLLGRYFRKHLGGYTGDCLGAAQQVFEIVFYLGVVSLMSGN
ncbi:MAG: adenosylcobinamide-GDP ribazoletransferase [Thermodesulfobacteriota bacterium]